MVFDNMFVNSSLLGAAMQASTVRNDVINNNIANNDVPGFKKSVVEFETLLANEIERAKSTGVVELDRIVPQVKLSMKNFSYRLDENNVDIETEMVESYKNASKYDTLANSLMNNYKRINLVIASR